MVQGGPLFRKDIGHLCLCGLIFFMALGLKLHYRTADAPQLAWILSPTAMLVEQLSGLVFVKEMDSGYLNAARGVLIAPACAGVNFMIVCFCIGSLAGLRRPDTMFRKLCWIALMPVVAFALTVITNALRIMLSIKCYYWDTTPWGLSPEELHRVVGTLVYFFCLWLFYMLLHQHRAGGRKYRQDPEQRFARMQTRPSFLRAGLVPLIGYWLVTVIIPVLNASIVGTDHDLTGHIRSVIIVSLGLFGLLQIILLAVKVLTTRWPSQ